jgi:hypothetical protein
LAGLDAALIDDRTKGRREPAAEAGCGDEIDLIGQTDKILVGVLYGDVLSETAPSGKPRLELTIADLLIAIPAVFASAAAANERQGYAVADPKS